MSHVAAAVAEPHAAPAPSPWRPVLLAFNQDTGSYELRMPDGTPCAEHEPEEAEEPPPAPFDMFGWVALCGPAWGNVFNGPGVANFFDSRPAALSKAEGLTEAPWMPAVGHSAQSVRQGLALYA